MKPRILLLVNPPIYDFTAYDFWLKPYGLLRVAGFLRGHADFSLFDYLDRLDSRVPGRRYRSDTWGRGEFYSEPQAKPAVFAAIPRRYRRLGLPRDEFQKYLQAERPFDFVFLQSGMTYWYIWYRGLREVSEDLCARSPLGKSVCGGVYATLCPAHARNLGVDLVIEGQELAPLWRYLCLAPGEIRLPFLGPVSKSNRWRAQAGRRLPLSLFLLLGSAGLSEISWAPPVERSLAASEFLLGRGVIQVAFYDDALLNRTTAMDKVWETRCTLPIILASE